jgi:hypothetical protein
MMMVIWPSGWNAAWYERMIMVFTSRWALFFATRYEKNNSMQTDLVHHLIKYCSCGDHAGASAC